MQRIRIFSVLILTLFFIYGVPFIPFFEDKLVSTGVILAILFAIAAAIQKAWFDVYIASFIAFTLGGGRLIFSESIEYIYLLRYSSTIAFLFLTDVLLIGPWSRYSKTIQSIYKHRRHLGVTTFLLGLLHASIILREYFDYSLEQALTSSYVFFGETTLIVMLWLALTSWDKAQKKLSPRWWNIIYSAVFIQFLLLAWISWNTAVDMTTGYAVLMVLFILVWLLLAPFSISQKLLERVNGWKQLHLAVYVAYTALVVHAWNAYISYMDGWVPVAFLILVGIVCISHVHGWIHQLQRRRTRKQSELLPHIIEKDDGKYIAVGAPNYFEDGTGKQVTIFSGSQIAVFRDGENFFGIAAICPHQGGPLAEGTIVNGYVECPWHQWQFGVNNGSGPPGFSDCVPYYPGIVENDVVFIRQTSTGKCVEKNGHAKYKE